MPSSSSLSLSHLLSLPLSISLSRFLARSFSLSFSPLSPYLTPPSPADLFFAAKMCYSWCRHTWGMDYFPRPGHYDVLYPMPKP